jgi:glycine oxidase
MQQLQRASLDMFCDYCADLKERTGVDPDYIPCGSIELLFDEQRQRMALSEQRAGQTTAEGEPEWQVVTLDEARQIEPHLSGDCLGALHCRVTAQVRNPRLLQALVAACKVGNVRIEEDAPVHELIVEGERVAGVMTARERLVADRVILCAGAWSSEIDQRVGTGVRTYPVRGQIVLLDTSDCPTARFGHIVDRKGCYLVPRRDNLVLVGATVEHDAGYERRNTPAGVNKLLSDALTLIPALAHAGVAALWAGLRPGTPDRRPYLGNVPGLDGLIAATGHYRTGLALAPITAEVVADLITKGASERDLSLCRPGRLT